MFLAIVFLIAATLVVSPPMAVSAERFHLTGSDVSIYNLAGEVRLEPYNGSDVIVELTRGGDEAERLRIETGVQGSRRTLRVIYPETRIVYAKLGRGSSTNLRVRTDGTFGDGGPKQIFDSGRRVTIVGGGDGLEAHADLRILVPRSKDVAVYLGAGAASASDVISDLRIETGTGAVTCNGTRGTLFVDTGSGSVRVKEAQGVLDIDTGSGDVLVEDVQGSKVHVDTGSGSVVVGRARTDALHVDTGSGDVLISDLDTPNVHVDTGSGRVSVELVQDSESVNIDTGSGSVLVRVPSDYGAQFVFDTGSGGIDVDVPHTLTKRDHGYMSGRIGTGDGTLKIDTGSGSIQVARSSGR